jgi:hypothetical protein
MRFFSHVNDFREEGIGLVPAMTFFATERLSLWSPSAWLVRRAKEQGKTFLFPSDLADLVEQERIQVMGREDYILGSTRTRELHPWIGAEWVPGFDDRISRLAMDDQDRPPSDRRVRLLGKSVDARGLAVAERRLESGGDTLVGQANELIERGRLPGGVLERAKAHLEPKLRARELLRALTNHEDAFADSGADIPLEPMVEDNYLHVLSERKTEPQKTSEDPVDASMVLEALRAAARLPQPRTVGDLTRALDSRDRGEVARSFGRLVKAGPRAAGVLARDIEEGIKVHRWTESALVGPVPLSTVSKIGSALLALADLALGGPKPVGLAGLAFWALDSATGALSNASLIRNVGYSGPRWPIAYTGVSTRGDMERLVAQLRRT